MARVRFVRSRPLSAFRFPRRGRFVRSSQPSPQYLSSVVRRALRGTTPAVFDAGRLPPRSASRLTLPPVRPAVVSSLPTRGRFVRTVLDSRSPEYVRRLVGRARRQDYFRNFLIPRSMMTANRPAAERVAPRTLQSVALRQRSGRRRAVPFYDAAVNSRLEYLKEARRRSLLRDLKRRRPFIGPVRPSRPVASLVPDVSLD